MSERLHHQPVRPVLENFQFNEFVRALFAFFAALWLSKLGDDTAIAWEDGEGDEDHGSRR